MNPNSNVTSLMVKVPLFWDYISFISYNKLLLTSTKTIHNLKCLETLPKHIAYLKTVL